MRKCRRAHGTHYDSYMAVLPFLQLLLSLLALGSEGNLLKVPGFSNTTASEGLLLPRLSPHLSSPGPTLCGRRIGLKSFCPDSVAAEL